MQFVGLWEVLSPIIGLLDVHLYGLASGLFASIDLIMQSAASVWIP